MAEPASAEPAELETGIPDTRDTSAPDPAEHAKAERPRQVPDADDTAGAVARAQAALAEIAARRDADHAREAAEAEAGRREELTRWAEHDQTADHAPGTHHDDAHDAEARGGASESLRHLGR